MSSSNSPILRFPPPQTSAKYRLLLNRRVLQLAAERWVKYSYTGQDTIDTLA